MAAGISKGGRHLYSDSMRVRGLPDYFLNQMPTAMTMSAMLVLALEKPSGCTPMIVVPAMFATMARTYAKAEIMMASAAMRWLLWFSLKSFTEQILSSIGIKYIPTDIKQYADRPSIFNETLE